MIIKRENIILDSLDIVIEQRIKKMSYWLFGFIPLYIKMKLLMENMNKNEG